MKASEMTNEELVSVLAEIPRKSWHDLDRETVHDTCREAAARLRRPCVKSFKCDSLEERLAVAQRRLKVAENALKKCAKVQCDGYDDSITCEECDLACDGRCAQWMAKKALAAIHRDGGAK